MQAGKLAVEKSAAQTLRHFHLSRPSLSRTRRRVCFAQSSEETNNLGELNRFLTADEVQSEQQSLIEAGEWQARVSKDTLSNRGLYADPGSIFASSVLLIVLLSLSFNRIFGLERLFDQWLLSMSPKARMARMQREDIEAARKRFSASWEEGDGGGRKGHPDEE